MSPYARGRLPKFFISFTHDLADLLLTHGGILEVRPLRATISRQLLFNSRHLDELHASILLDEVLDTGITAAKTPFSAMTPPVQLTLIHVRKFDFP